jgi:purine-binding chemotaxis protein CheW
MTQAANPSDVLDVSQYLAFSLAGEMYAIPLLGVKEIIEYSGVTPIPTMPEFIRGVINLRGRVVPVMDMSARFGDARTEVGERTCIVILEQHQDGREQDMGVVVDGVNAVVDIVASDIEPPPTFGACIRVDFIQGMWKFQERFVVILDLARVLSVEEITRITTALQEQDEA